MADLPRYRDFARSRTADLSPIGGAGQAESQLAGVFANFANKNTQIAADVAQNAGRQAGLTEGAAGKPQPKSGFSGISEYGRAYNSAAEAAYVSKMDTDVASAIGDFERANEAEPDKFLASAGAYAAETLKGVDPAYRAQVGQVLNQRIAASRARLMDQAKAIDDNANVTVVAASLPTLVETTVQHAMSLPPDQGDVALAAGIQEYTTRIDGLLNDHLIDPSTAERMKAEAHKTFETALQTAKVQPIVDKITAQMRANAETGDAQIAKFMSNPGIDTDTKALVWDAYDKARKNLHDERSRLYADQTAAFSADLSRGAYGPAAQAQARSFYAAGASSVDEYQGFMSHIAQNEKTAIESGVDTRRVQAVMTAPEPTLGLSPTDAADKKAVNTYFEQATTASNIAVGSPQYQAFATELARKTNILPESADNWARASMLSASPDMAAQGAAFYDKVRKANLAAWPYARDEKVTAFANEMVDRLAAGQDPAQAYDAARALTYDLEPKKRDLLMESYRKDKVAKTNGAALQDALDSDPRFKTEGMIFKNSIPAPLDMQAEYQKLVEDQYLLSGGDLGKARSRAAESLMSTWAYSEVNGSPQLLKYAPERMFPQLTNDEILFHKAEVLNSVGFQGAAESVVIMPAPGATEYSGGAAWALMVPDEYGQYDTVRDQNNMPVFFGLPSTATERRDAADAQKKKLLDEAKARRVNEFDPAKQAMTSAVSIGTGGF